MERFFQILAVILAGVAAYFLWQGNAERAFVTAVFGAVSFFLSVRVQVKGRLNQREAERLEAERRREAEEIDEEEAEEEISDSEPLELNEIPASEQTGSEQRTTANEPKI